MIKTLGEIPIYIVIILFINLLLKQHYKRYPLFYLKIRLYFIQFKPIFYLSRFIHYFKRPNPKSSLTRHLVEQYKQQGQISKENCDHIIEANLVVINDVLYYIAINMNNTEENHEILMQLYYDIMKLPFDVLAYENTNHFFIYKNLNYLILNNKKNLKLLIKKRYLLHKFITFEDIKVGLTMFDSIIQDVIFKNVKFPKEILYMYPWRIVVYHILKHINKEFINDNIIELLKEIEEIHIKQCGNIDGLYINPFLAPLYEKYVHYIYKIILIYPLIPIEILIIILCTIIPKSKINIIFCDAWVTFIIPFYVQINYLKYLKTKIRRDHKIEDEYEYDDEDYK